MMRPAFHLKVLRWFDQHGRHDLPWQIKKTPYCVWVSEVMLQQTQVSTVIPYYQKFMQRFPSVKALAQAEVDEVLQHWSGLGYYARGRNLHRCAQILHERYRGRFPNTVEEIAELPGIGRSTAGAILSLSRDIRAPILDGNVKRVLTRFFALEGLSISSAFIKQLWEVAEELTPVKRCRDYNQAMMDMGALICTRSKPQCHKCPLQNDCQAYQLDAQALYPNRKKKTARTQKKVFMLVIENQRGEILLEKRPPSGIWGGLWSFPECESLENAKAFCLRQLGCQLRNSVCLKAFKHSFSHFDLWVTPVKVKVTQGPLLMNSDIRIWYNRETVLRGGVSAVVNKLMSINEVVV